MYWYFTPKEERPRSFLVKINEKVESGEFEKLPKDEQQKIIGQVVTWEQSQGKNFYDPNDKVYRWFLMPQWIKGLRGGNQSGKSASCIMDFVMQAEGWHPLQKENMERIIEETFDDWVKNWLTELYKRKIFYSSPPVKLRCVAVDYPFVERVVGQEFEKWATKELLEEVAYTQEKKRKMSWQNGSFVEFLTHDQGLSLAGAARDGVYHDEEPPEDVWDQSMLRVVNRAGRLTLGMTAERGITWSQKAIWEKGLTQKDQQIYAEELSTYDNPTNTQEAIDRIKLTCTSDEAIEIKIYGKGTPRGGRVYEVAKDTHPWIIEPFQIPEQSGYLIRAIDPHGKLPHAVLWIWVDYDGLFHPLSYVPDADGEMKQVPNLYEVAEVFEPCNIPTLAAFIREKETYELGRKADFELCDPSAWNTDQNNPKTVADQLVEAGLMVTPASKDRTSGIIRVKDMLSLSFGKELPEDKEKSVIIRRDFPQIMCFDTLENLRNERKKYRWKQPRMKFKEDVAIPQKPVDKDDHFMENEYRIALFVIDGELDLVKMPEEQFEWEKMQKSPVIINGNKMDVDFKEENHLITDAYLG